MESKQANKNLVLRYLERVISEGDYSTLSECVAQDVAYSSCYTFQPVRGLVAYQEMVVALRRGFPDLHITVEDCLAEDDRVAARWTANGTHTGEFMGFPPSNRKVMIKGMSMYRIADGKIVEGWLNEDSLGILQQIGLIPS
jgi:steroid delta-isomerase-like uncharacterized protein